MTSGLVTDLSAIIGADGVSNAQTDFDKYSGDALGVYRAFERANLLSQNPGAIVWPSTVSHVSKILQYAQSNRVPVVPYGGGTGVMGGATAINECIVLNMKRFDAIKRISREDLTATFQACVVLEDANRAMKQYGLILGHDPWSRPIATIAGAISTNGVGYRAAKYGTMGDQVLGLEVVMPDGEIVHTKNVPKTANGPDINSLLIGSEGTFGVITEATIKAFPKPEKRVLALYDFPEFEDGFNAVTRMYEQEIRPAMIDYGEEFWNGERDNDAASLYLAFEGPPELVELQAKRARQVCVSQGGIQGSQDEIEKFWKTRHLSGENYKRDVLLSANPGKARRDRTAYRMDYLHVALPTSKVLDYRRACQKILADQDVIVREWSLWAKPEFFSFLIVEREDLRCDSSQNLSEVVDEVLRLAQDMGGTMEYCHGVGVKLSHLAEREMGSGYSIIRKMKAALDPANILNPGKLFV